MQNEETKTLPTSDSEVGLLAKLCARLVKVFFSNLMRSFYWCLLLMGVGYIASKFFLTHPQFSPWGTFWILPIFWAGMAYEIGTEKFTGRAHNRTRAYPFAKN